MRKSKLTAEEIEAAEMAADERKQNRKNGFSLADIRDRGWTRLSNGVIMEWWVEKEKRQEYIAYPNIPQGKFMLTIDGRSVVYDADDFRKFLRWV